MPLNAPLHGGDLARAMAQYGGDAADWIDMSTGIAPWAYPLPAMPAALWHSLPDGNAALLVAARAYYGCGELLAVAGSQAAINHLPHLRPTSRVGVLRGSYAEHGWRWAQAGHTLVELESDTIDAMLATLDVLVLVNPDNPTGRLWPLDQLRRWQAQLAARGGWLVVDEAFMDATPEHSLLPDVGAAELIVLRSVGKFFGLAGMRLGFVAAEAGMRQLLATDLGPWAVSAPAQWAGQIALADRAWHVQQRQRLVVAGAEMRALLTEAGLTTSGASPLMHWCEPSNAAQWQAALAREQVWCRSFNTGLRFGLAEPDQHKMLRQRVLAAARTITGVSND